MDSEVSDIKKQYSNDKKESIEESKENRRSNRIECIISILAITVTVCGGMFSFSKYVLNILPNTLSFFYIFLWGVILYIFASVLIVFYDIVMFVWKEIKRHDILDDKCSLYDNESDKAYNKITGDFSFHLLILGVLFCIFIFTFIYDALLKILVVIVFSPLIIFLIINFIRKKILTNEKVVAFIKKKKEAIINKLQPIIDWFSPRIKKIYKKIRIFFSPLYWFISVTVLIVYYIVKIPIYYLVITPVYYTIKLVYKVVRFFIKSKFYDGIKKFIITGYIGLILFVIIITFNYIGNSKIEMTYNTDGTLILLTPGRNRHSEAERNRQFVAERKSQCISYSFL